MANPQRTGVELMPSIRITRLDQRDRAIAAQIRDIQRAAYAVEATLIGYPDLPPLRDNVNHIQHSTDSFLGGFLGTSLAGLLSYEQHENRLHICRLAVHPDWTRRGVATALLQAVEQQSVRPMLTVSTAALNAPALTLYQKHGFTLTQRTTTPDGLVLVLLTKSIPPLL